MLSLVTGGAGFIGFHLASRLLSRGTPVVVIDNLNDYYDPKLKQARLEKLRLLANQLQIDFHFEKVSLEDSEAVNSIFKNFSPTHVVNLAAQAGVRYSIENPTAYIQSNILGFNNILEASRHYQVKHLIYASSSSVYGGNTALPFVESQSVDHPVSLYAATKKANELMAHTYSHLYGIPSTGLRFFTVYGPWGRPDMALFLFTRAILNGDPINVHNKGDMIRDFTYIDDIIESVIRVHDKPASPDIDFSTNEPDPSTSWAPSRIFNIGNSTPIPLMEYIHAIEEAIGKEGNKIYLPMQPGDVRSSMANTEKLRSWIDFSPNTPIKEGVREFVSWYREFYLV